MIDQHKAASRTSEAHDPLDDFIGAFDDDVPDISSTVRETLDGYYRKNMAVLIDTSVLVAAAFAKDSNEGINLNWHNQSAFVGPVTTGPHR